jgi:hypothetical protein
MTFRFRKTVVGTADPRKPAGGWYADPYGTAARRWYDDHGGWTDQVQGAGREPDKTGVARVDEASTDATKHPGPIDESPIKTQR